MALFKSKAKREEKKAKVAAAKTVKKTNKAEKKAAKKSEPKKNKGKLLNFIKKGAAKLVSLGEDAVYAPLLPFKPAMTRSLDSKNITHDKSLHDIAIQFAKHVIKVSHFEAMAFEALHVDSKSMGISSAPAPKVGLIKGALQISTGNVGGAAQTLIQAIVRYFKGLADKKAAAAIASEKGLPVPEEDKLTPDEKTSLDTIEDTSKAIVETGEKDGVPDGDGSVMETVKGFFSNPIALGVGGIVLIIGIAVMTSRPKSSK